MDADTGGVARDAVGIWCTRGDGVVNFEFQSLSSLRMSDSYILQTFFLDGHCSVIDRWVSFDPNVIPWFYVVVDVLS